MQTYSRFGAPFTSALTRCTFGSNRRLVRWCEWDTRLPKNGFFPQISQTAAMARTRVTNGRAYAAGLPATNRTRRFASASAVSGPFHVETSFPEAP